MKTKIAVGMLLVFGALARADEAPRPKLRPEAASTKMIVVVDASAKTPRVVIPRSVLKVDKRRSSADSLRTLMAGMGLALAFAGGGMWIVRRRPGSKTVAMLACGVLLSLGMAAWADLAVGPRPHTVASFEKATVMVDDTNVPLEIHLSPADLAKLSKMK